MLEWRGKGGRHTVISHVDDGDRGDCIGGLGKNDSR